MVFFIHALELWDLKTDGLEIQFRPLRSKHIQTPLISQGYYRDSQGGLKSMKSSVPPKLMGIEYLNTPQKSNIDTQNGHTLKESPFANYNFWVSSR